MKKSYTFLLPALLLAACTEGNELVDPMAEGAMEITSITAEIGEAITRAGSGNTDYVGRSEFVKAGDANNASGDVMLLTTVKRSDHPIDAFTYSNVKFSCNNNGGWDRTFGEGLEASDRIFWSDNKTGHTFIGYSTPMAWNAEKWVQSGSEFSGAFTYTTEGDKKIVDFTTDQKLKDEDILLTHSNEVKAEANGLSTKIHFKHALASLRVIVNINDFSPSSTSEDVKTKIYDLVVMNQPYKYKWTQAPREVGGLQIPGWGVENTTTTDDGVVEIKTWQPHPEGEGDAEARIFTFYSLIVPGIQNNFEIGYKVTYPRYDNPDSPDWTIENYDAKLLDANGNPAEIKFLPGYCTTVKVSLNHRGEPIYLGALYIDWEDQITPDKSELKKISTFLDKASPTYDGGGNKIVSIASDRPSATPDDATWLYFKTVYDEQNQSSEVLVDGYGNDGTQEHPFTIKTAREFLSFAYEVKDGRHFTNQFIILDSDLFLQESINKTTVTWPGIGDADHPFNGTFIGGHRKIKYLQGSPLFYSLGENAHVGHLILEEVISCTGNGVFAETNKGLIGASMVGSRRFNTTNPGAFTLTTSAALAGAFCGTNNGVLLACYSNAMFKVSGSATSVGGLVGQNTGTMVSCYAAGGIDGVSSPMGVAGSNTGTMTFCLFDKDKNTKTEISTPDGGTEEKDGTGAIAKTTLVMQQPEIVGARTSTEATSLNGNLHAWIENDKNVSLLGKFFPTGTTKTQIQAHMSDIYYNYFVAAYPSIH